MQFINLSLSQVYVCVILDVFYCRVEYSKTPFVRSICFLVSVHSWVEVCIVFVFSTRRGVLEVILLERIFLIIAHSVFTENRAGNNQHTP